MNRLRDEAIDLAETFINVHYFGRSDYRALIDITEPYVLAASQFTRVSISYDPEDFTRLCVDFHARCVVLQCNVLRLFAEFEYSPAKMLMLYRTLASACRKLAEHEAAIGLQSHDRAAC